MDFEEYQRRVAETAIYPDTGSGDIKALMYCAGSATGEAGEVWGQVKKAYRDDYGQVTDERKEKIRKEIGDTLWYLAQLCNELRISGSEVMRDNLTKLALRKETGTLGGDGDDRELAPRHYVKVVDGTKMLMAHIGCTFDLLVCPYTLAAQVERSKVLYVFPPALYTAALDGYGHLRLFEVKLDDLPQGAVFQHEVKAVREGWNLTFVPTRGRQEGNEITRTFWYESKEEAMVWCRQAYGDGTEIKSGERTDGTGRF